MRRPIRLLHVVYSLRAGGLENGVVNLCNRLDPQLFSPTICVFEGGGELESRVDDSRVTIKRVRRFFGNDPSLPVRLAKLMRGSEFDIAHTHNWVTLVEGFAAAKLASIPAVIHGEHGYPFEIRRRNICVQSAVWQRLAQLTTVSRPLAEDLVKFVGFPRDRIAVIPNGVDSDCFRPRWEEQHALRIQLGLPDRGCLVGSVARLDPIKNHAGVVHVIADLNRHGNETYLVLAGDGPERDRLERLAQDLGVSRRLIFLGNVSNVSELLCALDVFVLNSQCEGMSNTVLEAMACGLPVVATSVGANPDVIDDGHSGYLIAPDDGEALRHILMRLTSDAALRNRLGMNARRRIEKLFRVERMVQDYTDLYMRVYGRTG